jgi:hypothetical protein
LLSDGLGLTGRRLPRLSQLDLLDLLDRGLPRLGLPSRRFPLLYLPSRGLPRLTLPGRRFPRLYLPSRGLRRPDLPDLPDLPGYSYSSASTSDPCTADSAGQIAATNAAPRIVGTIANTVAIGNW